MRPADARKKLKAVQRALRKDFGPRVFKPGGSAVGVLVGTILSQNTSGSNSGEGYRRLRRRFRSWSAAADAPVGQIERCIRVSGLSRIKAGRIRRILRQIRDRSRSRRPSLAFLRDWPDDKAYEYLLGFDGVGPKTAACVLMFAFGKKVFPVDTHIRRIASRLAVIPLTMVPERAQEALAPLISPADRYALHVLLIAHGRAVCRARSPRCGDCSLLPLCPYGKRKAKARASQ